MEGDMVNDTWLNSTFEVIKEYFQKEFPQFSITKEVSHGPYWDIEFNFDILKVEIHGDIGFSIYIYINGSKFDLWQYNRSVNERMKTSKENILYQLNVLKQFLDGLI